MSSKNKKKLYFLKCLENKVNFIKYIIVFRFLIITFYFIT